ncbi:hypothetical protein DFH07DRAFT_940283 [Mycena maculata]|uniref:Uncharacterized protein n=1 Tax=Mycena maculata TaxID=230809 RepID=A0AAD7JAE1_9AGAR|nr:hypothetical protein DFH07DRAFT_940283 [Mycena maculata]
MDALNLLPPHDDSPPLTQTIPPAASTYRFVIAAEKDAVQRYSEQHQPQAVKDAAAYNIVASRVVGLLSPALFNMPPILGDTPITTLTTEHNATRRYTISGESLVDTAIVIRTTTTPTLPPSRWTNWKICLRMQIQCDHRTARTRALARDGYYCMVTNTIDANSWEKNKAVKELGSKIGAAIHDVQTSLTLSALQRQHAGAASRAHDLFNIISLKVLHAAFGRLKLAFEPTADGERYSNALKAAVENNFGYLYNANVGTAGDICPPSWRHCDKSDADFGVNLFGRRLCGIKVALASHWG